MMGFLFCLLLFRLSGIIYFAKATMPHINQSFQPRDMLTMCNIMDPLLHRTCIGTAKKGSPCKNLVSKKSRETASHRLEILAMCPTDDSPEWKLRAVAGFLCKRRHQDQAAQISQKWYDRLNQPGIQADSRDPVHSLSNLRDNLSRAERRSPEVPDRVGTRNGMYVAGAPLSPSLEGSSPSSPSSPVRQSSQQVTPAMVRESQVPFHISSSRLAAVSVCRTDGRVHVVTLRTFRKGRRISEVECNICREDRSDDTAYLNCEECAGEFHWWCMENWLKQGPPQSNFTCPHWYEALCSFH